MAASDAERFYKAGRRAEREGRDLQAFIWYQRARGKDPSQPAYAEAAETVRKRASQSLAALGKYQSALAFDPGNPYLADQVRGFLLALPDPTPRPRRPAPPPLRPPVILEPDDKRASFRVSDEIRAVYEEVAKEYGLEVIFDSDFQGSDQTRFVLEEVSFRDAIIGLNDVAQAFVIPVTSKLFLVAEDTTQKRNELEPVTTVIVSLPDVMNPEELQQVADAVRQILEMKRVQINTASQKVTIRDTLSRVYMAQLMMSRFSRPRAEVVIDVDLMTVADNAQVDLGTTLPTSFPVTNFSTVFNAQPPEGGSGPLLGIGGGETVFGIAIGDASVVAQGQRSHGRVLQSFQLRSVHGLPGQLLIGERFPIINARFSAPVINDQVQDAIDTGTFREPFPSFTYEDLGLSFKVTPQVHSAREITLEIETEVKQLTGQSVNDVPILSNRSMSTTVRVKEGEVAVITGMKIFENRRTRSGLAVLSRIPFLGELFQDRFIQLNTSDLLLVLRPRLTRLPPGEMTPSLALRYGPEQRPIPLL